MGNHFCPLTRDDNNTGLFASLAHRRSWRITLCDPFFDDVAECTLQVRRENVSE